LQPKQLEMVDQERTGQGNSPAYAQLGKDARNLITHGWQPDLDAQARYRALAEALAFGLCPVVKFIYAPWPPV
jgi:hypothetical protein